MHKLADLWLYNHEWILEEAKEGYKVTNLLSRSPLASQLFSIPLFLLLVINSIDLSNKTLPPAPKLDSSKRIKAYSTGKQSEMIRIDLETYSQSIVPLAGRMIIPSITYPNPPPFHNEFKLQVYMILIVF